MSSTHSPLSLNKSHLSALGVALMLTLFTSPVMASGSITEDLGDIAPGAPGILNAEVEPLDSCDAIKAAGATVSGLYRTRQPGQPAVVVFCDMTLRGGGWTVISRRVNGDVPFDRNWVEYKYGFGDLDGNFWMGLENIKALLDTGEYELHVGFAGPFGNYFSARYDFFSLGPEATNYELNLIGPNGYSFNSSGGNTALDSFEYQDGRGFSTFDRDNDTFEGNCAETFGGDGGWWYDACFGANLNGIYYPTGLIPNNQQDGIVWSALYGRTISHLNAVMAIRRL